MHSSVSNIQFSQSMQKWHSLRFYIARTGVTESRELDLHIETRSHQAGLSCESVARIDHFSPANNSFVLLFPIIISVHTIIFHMSNCVYVLFRFQNGVLSDILRCVQFGGQTRTDAAFSVAFCALLPPVT